MAVSRVLNVKGEIRMARLHLYFGPLLFAGFAFKNWIVGNREAHVVAFLVLSILFFLQIFVLTLVFGLRKKRARQSVPVKIFEDF